MGLNLIFVIHVKFVDLLVLKIFYKNFSHRIRTNFAKNYPMGFDIIFVIYVKIVDN